MHFPISLAWLYWNPSKEAFTIPYFDLPIMKYGVLFAIGFIVGYLILLPTVKYFIAHNQAIYARDIVNWKALVEYLQTSSNTSLSHICTFLNKQERQELKITDKEPSEGLKKGIIRALNRALHDSDKPMNRQQIELLLPRAIAKANSLSIQFTDRLVWFIVLGTIIGARLGHVFFYDWEFYQAHPLEILMIRKGGLASHGGTVGVMLAIFFFMRLYRKQFPEFSFVALMDLLVVPTAFTACCIRLGNFFNQEIVGKASALPWAVIFAHPAEGGEIVPRHPAQLYEALAYLLTFVVLFSLWTIYKTRLKPGTLSGLFFILIFGSRFFIEFLKVPQSGESPNDFLQMGQYLSIPFICLGIALLLLPRNTKRGSVA